MERREFDFNLRVTPLPDLPKENVDATRTEIRRLSREAYATPKEKVVEKLSRLWTAHETAADEEEERRSAERQRKQEQPASAPASVMPPPAISAGPPAVSDIPVAPEPASPISIPKLPATPGRGGPEHKRIQHLLKMVGESLGWRCTTEAPVPGGSADLQLDRGKLSIGVQISISNHIDAEIEGLKKCLAAGFTHVLMVCDDSKKLERIQVAAELVLAEEQRSKLKWLLKDEAPGFLQAMGGTAPPGMVAGHIVKVKQQASLEGTASVLEQMNKAVAKAMSKRKKSGEQK